MIGLLPNVEIPGGISTLGIYTYRHFSGVTRPRRRSVMRFDERAVAER